MGGRGMASRRGGGGGGAAAAGSGPPSDGITMAEVDTHVAAQVDKLPRPVAEVIVREGVKYEVIDRDAARRLDPGTVDLAGWYDPRRKIAYVVHDAERGRAGLRDAGMTILHELGHAYHVATGAAFTPEFDAAYAAGRTRIAGMKSLSDAQRRRLIFEKYGTEAERQAEVWSESFAIVYGEGRPKPAVNWNNSRQFQQVWREAVDVVRRQTGGES